MYFSIFGFSIQTYRFDVESKHAAFYTGGNIEWHEGALYCQTESNINLLKIESGLVTQTIGESESEDSDLIQTFTSDGDRLVSSHKSGLLKLWNRNGELEKMWKYIHKGPIAKLALKGVKLVSGGADGVIRVWDLQHQACTLSLKGCNGVVNVIEFHPREDGLFASGDDGKINYYKLEKGELKIIHDAHYSKVTSVAFAHDDLHFVSCGRDKVMALWQFNKNVAIKTIALYEAVEVIVSLPLKFKLPGFRSDPESFYVASAGENGMVRVWDVQKSKEVFVQSNSLVSRSQENGCLAITHLIYDAKSKSLAVVTSEHNIIIHHLKSFVCTKQFVGYSDEILDVAILGKNDSHTAIATNSSDIKLYENTTMSCRIFKGHTDIVLSLDVCKSDPNLLASCGKDNSVRLWHFDGVQIRCVGVGKRHVGSVGSVAFSQTSPQFFVSASQDTCLKMWDLSQNIDKKRNENQELSVFDETFLLNCARTEIAHEKDINCVSVSPNDKIIGSASKDKTVKLWSDKLELMGVLKGHKRGVWSVRFSPVDQVVLTSSADCTVKLWSVANLSCLKTLEGHESSVLKAEFISKGMQILSAGADGLIKMFSIKNSECQCTLAEHDGRIWAMAIKNDESGFITGGSDSRLIKWKDVTEERKRQRQKEAEELALHEQKLNNYIQNDELLKALKLALKLDRPLQTLKIIQGVIKKGDAGLSDTIKSLRNDQKESLMNCALSWNTNSRNCHPAQLVLNILLNEVQGGEFRPVGLSKMTEGALPYTERHFKRLTQLMQDVRLLDYVVNCMQPHARTIG